MLTGTSIFIGVAVVAVIVVAFLVMKGTKYDESIHTDQSMSKKTPDKPVEKQEYGTSSKTAAAKKASGSPYPSAARRDKAEDIYSNPVHPANPLNPLYMDVGEDRPSRSSSYEDTRPSSGFDDDSRTSYSSGSSSYDSGSSSYDSGSSSYDSGSSSSGSDSSSW